MSRVPSFSYLYAHSGQIDTTPQGVWKDSTSHSQATPACTNNAAGSTFSFKLHSRLLMHLIQGNTCNIKRRNR